MGVNLNMSVMVCLCDGLAAISSPHPMHAGIASSLLWVGNIVYGKWLNERIIVNDVKYLIEEGFKPLCAFAWTFLGKHHSPINKCVGNKCDRQGEFWTSSINHSCPWFSTFPRIFSVWLFPFCFLLHSYSLHNMFPFSLQFSHHSLLVPPAVVISFMPLLLLSPAPYRHIRRWKSERGPGDSTWPYVHNWHPGALAAATLL